MPARKEKVIRGEWPATVLREFAALLDAGVPVLDALKSLSRRHRGLSRVLPDAIAGLQRGFQLGDVLQIAGAISRQDACLVNIAEQSGLLQRALQDLAARHEQRQNRLQRLTTRLHLSRLVALIMVGIGVVLAIARGEAVGAALSAGILQVVMVLVVLGLLERMAGLDASTWLGWAWRLRLIHRVARLQRIFEHNFFTVVRWQLAAGRPAAEAVELALEWLDAPEFRAQAAAAALDLRGGMSFHDAMLGNDLIFSADLDQVIHSGEAAGRLDQSLEQYQELQQVQIDLQVDGLLDWLPRIAYVVVLSIAVNAISMHTFGGNLNKVPSEF